jgi:outer membrane lipoprotein SlyB
MLLKETCRVIVDAGTLESTRALICEVSSKDSCSLAGAVIGTFACGVTRGVTNTFASKVAGSCVWCMIGKIINIVFFMFLW